MEKIISIENLRSFAYCNNHLCTKPISGIVISFFLGLGDDTMFQEDPAEGYQFAEKGILYLIPYQNPWAWLNRQTVDFVDELIDVLFEEYNLPENLPIVSSGRSMGGLSALAYMVYAKRTPVACVANCPVCDLPYHFTERPDLPRTLYSAFATYEGTLNEAMRSVSPMHLIDQMPTQANYCIFHCIEDKMVNKQKHSDRFVEKMREHHHIQYFAVPERRHCDFTGEILEKYNTCILKSVNEHFSF